MHLSLYPEAGWAIDLDLRPARRSFCQICGAEPVPACRNAHANPGVLNKAKSRGVGYSFLFMRAEGQQLAEIAKLIDAGAIRPVVDKVFPFAQTADAVAYVETGRA